MLSVDVDVPGSVGMVTTQAIELSEPLQLESGQRLQSVALAYESYGRLAPARDNVILICHALSGDAHAAGWTSGDGITVVDGIGAEEQGMAARRGLGWWDNLIGPGKAFDTDRYFVICTNLLGSCRGSTGPASLNPATGRPYGPDFPTVTVADMVRAQRALLRELGIDSVLAVAGGSLGGMQALEWSVRYPEMIQSVVMTASTAALSTQGVAWNAIARNAILADPDWQGGWYYGTGRSPVAGIGVARMVGHVTYLSAEAMSTKFGRRLHDRNDYSYTVDGADFEVESYLRHQARRFAARFDANSYLYISRALTYFDLARDHGAGSLSKAVSKSHADFLLISFSSDWLYLPADSVKLASALAAAGKPVRHHEIHASYGHDSFLLDTEHQAPLIAGFLRELRMPSATYIETRPSRSAP